MKPLLGALAFVGAAFAFGSSHAITNAHTEPPMMAALGRIETTIGGLKERVSTLEDRVNSITDDTN